MVFDVCDIEKEDQGLTLNEVQKKSCMDHLTLAFGITNDNIVKTFEAVDQNGDSVISKQETSRAFENLPVKTWVFMQPSIAMVLA